MLAASSISVVAEGRDVRDVVDVGDPNPAPDLIIFHVASDSFAASPVEFIDELRRHFPAAKLVLLADPSAKPVLAAFVQADVSAVLLTEISGETLERSLDLVLSDHRLFPADIMSSITGGTRSENGDNHASDNDRPDEGNNHLALSPPLSRREYQVVRCLAIGLSNKTIARELNITEGTVKVHVKGLLRKVKAANRTQLAIWALRQANLMGIEPGRRTPTSTRHAA